MSLKDEVLALADELQIPKLYALANKVHTMEFTLQKAQQQLKDLQEAARAAAQEKIASIQPPTADKNACTEGKEARPA